MQNPQTDQRDQRIRRWTWATLLALVASGMGTSVSGAEIPVKKMTAKTTKVVWKSATRNSPSAADPVGGSAPTGKEAALQQAERVAGESSATPVPPAAQAPDAGTATPELPVKPVDAGASPTSLPSTGDSTVLPSTTGEVIEDSVDDCEVPVSVSCGLCPPGRLWARKEVLLWWMDGQGTPPLVTTSPNGTPGSQAGVLGQPGTQVIFSGPLNDDFNVGGRFQAGYWLDKCNTIGIQTGFFFLGQNSSSYTASSDGSSIIARPFNDVRPSLNAQNSELVSFPGALSGSVGVDSTTSILGGNIALRKLLCCKNSCAPACASTNCNVPGVYCCRWDCISGFQYFRLADNVSISENLTALNSGPAVPGTNIRLNDRFNTQNNFYGYDIGTVGSCYRGRWFLEGLFSIGIGAVQRTALISGNTTTTVPGGSRTVSNGGLLAQPTNIGQYDDTQFSVMPQVGLNVGYQVCKYARVFAGYTFLGITGIARAGEQIDPVLNSTQLGGGTLAGSSRPAFNWNDSFFWAQGVNIGLDCRF
ncbi:BBP7 family outer membrane beta-barrel protein [bacterium]|nr:BBP7 family outer membrane beta-barrel protein [bacterium]